MRYIKCVEAGLTMTLSVWLQSSTLLVLVGDSDGAVLSASNAISLNN